MSCFVGNVILAEENEREQLSIGQWCAEPEHRADAVLAYELLLGRYVWAIERLRDMKARLSTKMVGGTLEQHCETEFNRIRATAFPQAYFEKDTDVRVGSKGDYIFRDSDDSGNEIV